MNYLSIEQLKQLGTDEAVKELDRRRFGKRLVLAGWPLKKGLTIKKALSNLEDGVSIEAP